MRRTWRRVRSAGPGEVRSPHAPRTPSPPAGTPAETRCRVCGLDEGEERVDGTGSPQYTICSCCGAESGVDDLSTDLVRRYRDDWVARAAPWFTEAERPTGWTLAHQLTQIPPEWR